MRKSTSRTIKNKLQSKPVKTAAKEYLSTGSTMLNLACTGKPDCGLLKGHYYFFVGDSQSGKTWFALTMLAEAAINPAFKNYRFIHDNREGGALMDIAKYFGAGMLNRLEAPAMKKSSPVYSSTVEDFYYNVDDALGQGKPFIYILDSMDSLDSDAGIIKFQAKKKASRKGTDITGSMGDGKAKTNSQDLRKLLGPLDDTGSILIIINQTRDNLGFGFKKKTKSGGHALTFYATLEIWTSIKGKIKKRIKGKDREIGKAIKIETVKNRGTGRDRIVEVPIYPSVGIDDIGSCIDYLVSEGHWKTQRGVIIAPELRLKRGREAMVRAIESKGLLRDLKEIVAEVWEEIEQACSIQRTNKYGS